MAYIKQSELNKLRREIIKDIGESVLIEVKRKIKKRAYDSGQLMRSTELEITENGWNIGSHEKYAIYADNKRRLYNVDEYVDRGFDKVLR